MILLFSYSGLVGFIPNGKSTEITRDVKKSDRFSYSGFIPNRKSSQIFRDVNKVSLIFLFGIIPAKNITRIEQLIFGFQGWTFSDLKIDLKKLLKIIRSVGDR